MNENSEEWLVNNTTKLIDIYIHAYLIDDVNAYLLKYTEDGESYIEYVLARQDIVIYNSESLSDIRAYVDMLGAQKIIEESNIKINIQQYLS